MQNNGYTSYTPPQGYMQSPYPQKNNGGKVIRIVGIAVPIFVIFLGAIFFGAAYMIDHVFNEGRKTCTEKTTAVVTALINNSNNGYDRDGRYYSDNDHSSTVAPVFEYTVDGRLYSIQSNSYSYPPRYSVGDETEIFYDPDDPKKMYDPADTTSEFIVSIFHIVGGIMVIVGAVILIFVIVFINKNKNRDEIEEYYSFKE